MSRLPTYWYRTQYFWIGSSPNICLGFRFHLRSRRLPALEHEPGHETLLPHAILLLVSAIARFAPRTGETT